MTLSLPLRSAPTSLLLDRSKVKRAPPPTPSGALHIERLATLHVFVALLSLDLPSFASETPLRVEHGALPESSREVECGKRRKRRSCARHPFPHVPRGPRLGRRAHGPRLLGRLRRAASLGAGRSRTRSHVHSRSRHGGRCVRRPRSPPTSHRPPPARDSHRLRRVLASADEREPAALAGTGERSDAPGAGRHRQLPVGHMGEDRAEAGLETPGRNDS